MAEPEVLVAEDSMQAAYYTAYCSAYYTVHWPNGRTSERYTVHNTVRSYRKAVVEAAEPTAVGAVEPTAVEAVEPTVVEAAEVEPVPRTSVGAAEVEPVPRTSVGAAVPFRLEPVVARYSDFRSEPKFSPHMSYYHRKHIVFSAFLPILVRLSNVYKPFL